MNFPKFWALGKSGSFQAWRWSDASMEEAQTAANAAAAHVESAFKAAGGPPPERYGYADRPLREQVLTTLQDGAGKTIAAITRNSYGCDVLNTTRAMFVDVDLPETASAGGGLLGSLFGKKAQPGSDVDAVIEKATQWAQSQNGWDWRIYRTRAGLRLLATHALFDPTEATFGAIFDAVGADPLYRLLCLNQQSYRARLTPKPWRCGLPNPPARWPFANDNAQRAFESWNANYIKVAATRATCKLLSAGDAPVVAELQPIVDLHDKLTQATADLPLA